MPPLDLDALTRNLRLSAESLYSPSAVLPITKHVLLSLLDELAEARRTLQTIRAWNDTCTMTELGRRVQELLEPARIAAEDE